MFRKVIQYAPIVIFGILALLLQTGKVRFGHGLGDIVDHALIYLGLFWAAFFLIGKKNVSQKFYQVISILLIVFGFYLFLSMTIWRGPESRWDGNILGQFENNKYVQQQFHYLI